MTAATSDPEQWLERHGNALYAFALLRVQDAALAEDLVQDTLLAAFSGRDRFAGTAQERTWLTGILKHKIVDHLRKAMREETFDPNPEDDAEFAARFDHTGHWLAPPSHWHDPAFITENGELRAALVRCIGRLPERQRHLLVMRDVDGHDTAELCALLGISTPGNLWVMLSRARERVRTCIDALWAR